MSQLKIPARLDAKLAEDRKLHAQVVLALEAFEPWIADNKLPFFPEYTDHGPNHINSVMVTAESLITDQSWPILTPQTPQSSSSQSSYMTAQCI